MTNSAKFKNVETLDKFNGEVRYREDASGAVSIYDTKADNWIRVDEGDEIERCGDGFTVNRQRAGDGVITSSDVNANK